MKFSQRYNYKSGIKIAQRESVDEELKNGMWNVLTVIVFNKYRPAPAYGRNRADYVRGSNFEGLAGNIWIFYFKKVLDDMPPLWSTYLLELRNYFFSKASWYEVFDFVEFVSCNLSREDSDQIVSIFNKLLEEENSAYRFVSGKVVEITSQVEIDEVEAAVVASEAYSGVRTHLARAVDLLADRNQPDYRNSIKESISAVESLVVEVTGRGGTLGQLLKEVEKVKGLHPALKSAFASIYGYTNDADGIRHALLGESSLSKADAKFMLVCCSAFVNYVISLYGEKNKSDLGE
ncbi:MULTISPECIES: AbiJ-NTD4 domain-containing protein [Pseudomonas]|uniref:AbiJ-NTD4 domain-containing protein n=1 Tax=Pseudomonas TaxID=286 RepID=UPI001FF1B472|nr:MULTISPECIES: hypothetical protein [Pseudomonas]